MTTVLVQINQNRDGTFDPVTVGPFDDDITALDWVMTTVERHPYSPNRWFLIPMETCDWRPEQYRASLEMQ